MTKRDSGEPNLEQVSSVGMVAAILVSSVSAFITAAITLLVGAYLVAPDADTWGAQILSSYALGVSIVGIGAIPLSFIICFALLSMMKRRRTAMTSSRRQLCGMVVSAVSIVPPVLLGNHLYFKLYGSHLLAPSDLINTVGCFVLGMAPFGLVGASVLRFMLRWLSAPPLDSPEEKAIDATEITTAEFQPTVEDDVECTRTIVGMLRRLMRGTWPSAGYVMLNWCVLATILGLLAVFARPTSTLVTWGLVAAFVTSVFLQPRLGEAWQRLACSSPNWPSDTLPPRSCVINEHGITFTSAVEVVHRKWPRIQSIERAGDQILFFISNGQADYVPRRAFSSDATANSFLAAARRFWNSAKDNQDAAGVGHRDH